MVVAHAFDSQFPHDAGHLVTADLGRIPALGDQLGVDLAVSIHGHKEIRVNLKDIAGQRLMSGVHAAHGPRFEHAVTAWSDEPAIQRFGENSAYRPDLETVFAFVEYL